MEISEIEEKVFNALENPKYKWRTLKGIAKETGLDFGQVYEAIHSLIKQDKAIFMSKVTAEGDVLYTSWDRYKTDKKYRWNRLLSVLSDEVK